MVSLDPVYEQLGVCTYLIDRVALRVGNEKNEDEADTVGCCSLKRGAKHEFQKRRIPQKVQGFSVSSFLIIVSGFELYFGG